ncbi:hypothetical protein EDB81DRAFT_885572 [Dactylonectria macrodidyma]|uniref:Uncharacterized protein n=1 Tax=Dactylonectria macrodidyma TaxID=307937 RepID=A0A9P9IYV0_9HYPO|nr:hypothetical protein EDB81DRAFT_885572 [Dactylonectria macrodidyma]
MAPTFVLITGANRGLGLGLLKRYLALPNHVVIAGNRDPEHPTSKELANLPLGEGSRLIVVKIDASIDQDAFDAVEELQKSHGIERLDVVIANAGVSYVWPLVVDLKIDDLKGHMNPNVYGFVTLYQATRPLLQKSPNEPMFVPMGSTAGNLAGQLPIRNAAYGPSKAVVSWLTIRINSEDPWLNAWVMAPGWVQTDLGNAGAIGLGFEKAQIGVDESCDGMIKVFATSSKEKHGGKMVLYDGNIVEW